MLKLYDDLSSKYVLVAVFGGLLFMFLVLFLTESVIISFLFYSLFVFVDAIYFNIQANKRVNKINNYFDNCDAKTYTECYEKLFIKCKKDKRLETTVRISLSTGYISLGKNKEALDLLYNSCPVFKNNRIGIKNKTIYLNNLIVIYRNLKKYEEAYAKLNELELLMNNSDINSEQKDFLEKIYLNNKISLDIDKKPNKENLTYAKNYCNDKLKISKSKVETVNFNYKLAYISEKLKNKKETLEYLNFVAENGGSLYIVNDAKKRIKELNN